MRMLFHRHTPWQGDVRCSTNILARLFLEQGARVAYMQGIVHAGNVLARSGQWKSWKRGPRWQDGAFVFTPLSLRPYSRHWPFCTRAAAAASYRRCAPSIPAILQDGGFGEPDVIWTANPGSGSLKHLFPRARLVFQAVDFYPAFGGDRMREIEQADYEIADHVFVIGEALADYLRDELEVVPAKLTVLGQGVFLDRYRSDLELPAMLRGLPRPIGIWVGVLAKGDGELFAAAAHALEAMGGSLVLAGPPAPWASALAARSNVHLPGPCDPEQVPALLVNSDVGLMLYDRARSEVYRGQNPLKLYEYAAAGLPVVSTPHDEFRSLGAPVLTANDPGEVAETIRTALRDRDSWSAKSLEFARSRDWCSVVNVARSRIEALAPVARSL
jgi:glycosyltransferase involved in cell wall biosynthesis